MNKRKSQKETQECTARTLLVLASEFLGFMEHAERLRALIYALATGNNLRLPPAISKPIAAE